jgi:succinate dehydrogenase/fumarate reductase flavoprotein subunit
MWDCFGIFRRADAMGSGLLRIRHLKERRSRARIRSRSSDFNQAVVRHLELENMLLVAETVAHAALARRESRGSHYRVDFPARDDREFLSHSVTRMVDGEIRLSFSPVRLGRFPVEERVY